MKCLLDIDSVKYGNDLCSTCWGITVARCGCKIRAYQRCTPKRHLAAQVGNLRHAVGKRFGLTNTQIWGFDEAEEAIQCRS